MKQDRHEILDPRGVQARRSIELAERATLGELQAGTLLFYDNTKLAFAQYQTVHDHIRQKFADMGDTQWVYRRETVRGKSKEQLAAYAQQLAELKPTAAIVALGDMGTSSSTTHVAIALERLGIPTVYITAPPGAAVAEGVAHYHAGRLCLCPLDIYQGSSADEIAAEVDRQWDGLLSALTATGKRLEQVSALHVDLDREEPQADGVLPLPREIRERYATGEPGGGMEALGEHFEALHISDGLPVIPPTRQRVQHMLEYGPFDTGEVLCEGSGPSGRAVTVLDAAIAAVMAGCKPTGLPWVMAALRAMNSPLFNLNQAVTTSHPGGTLVLASGQIAQQAGLHGGQGCMGPGFAANATIGRAVQLVQQNVFRAVPGVCDLDCQSSPVQFTYCFAEDAQLARWETINQERFSGDVSTVYVMKAEAAHDVVDFLSSTGKELLRTITDSCSTLGSSNAYIAGPLVLCLTPDHAQILYKDGYSKQDIRAHIHKHATHAAADVAGRGLVPVRPEWMNGLERIPVTRSPQDIEVVVAGGRGGHSSVLLPWGLYSEGIVQPLTLPDGSYAQDLQEYRR